MTNFTIFPLANCPRLFAPTTFLRSRLRAALARIDAWERKINRNRCRRRRGWPILQDGDVLRLLSSTPLCAVGGHSRKIAWDGHGLLTGHASSGAVLRPNPSAGLIAGRRKT